ncbi:class II glutamine amidotransferase [Thioclava pacifica]|uniref:Glutamine amidotransferase type-2 domain-containing protein n=1 Tax=Thioclava pacifica DSM 10166 TaxID=1353537 RepID=A0A074JI34_9RHOB|nr:class II glutamine amidotransferase [Thioclava pacifica]KEO55268.1 hypothetical protein TP2_15865 [Thioclava pacifica DSM 10166]
MSELLAISSRLPTNVGFSLERLARRGGGEGPLRDGWGVALYQDRDVALLREPRAAAESELVRFIERQTPPSTLVISHIRLATRGAPALHNTQPFIRELGGRVHVFAHNGDMPGIVVGGDVPPGRFLPVGESDSERAFCLLLDQLEAPWRAAEGATPPLAERLGLVAGFAAELRRLGPVNFLYADGETLFAHAHRRRQADGAIRPPGLHVLERRCESEEPALDGAGMTLTGAAQEVCLLASVPLSDAPWQPLDEGEVIAVVQGQTAARHPRV